MTPAVVRGTLAASGALLSAAIILVLGAGITRAAQQAPATRTAPPNSQLPTPTAQGDPEVVQLRTNFYLIAGAGRNIGVETGTECVILVAAGSTAMADKVLATIRRLTSLPIRYIINTSMDADHVGGNEKLSRAGLSILPGAVVAGAGLSDDLISNSGA